MTRRTAWMLDLAVLAAGALALAWCTSSLIEAELWAPSDRPISTQISTHQRVTLSGPSMRRMFPTREPPNVSRSPSDALANAAPINLRLLATTVATRPEWSMALLLDDEGLHTALLGDRTANGVLAEIGVDYAIVKLTDGPRRIELGANPGPQPLASAAPIAANPGELTRAELQAALANPTALLTAARLVPAADGLHALEVSPDGLFARLGLRVGDVIRRIDGADCGDVIGLMHRAPELLERAAVTVELLRAGSPAQLIVRVRD